MRSHATAAGHPIHQQLIVFPLGLFATSVIFDAIYLLGGSEGFGRASYYMVGAGVIAGIVAAFFGWFDFFGIPSGTRAKRVGLMHGLGNATVILLFAISWIVRGDQLLPTATSFLLALIGAGISVVTGWLGGELVDRLGVGVDPEAHLNAAASFDTRLRFRKE